MDVPDLKNWLEQIKLELYYEKMKDTGYELLDD